MRRTAFAFVLALTVMTSLGAVGYTEPVQAQETVSPTEFVFVLHEDGENLTKLYASNLTVAANNSGLAGGESLDAIAAGPNRTYVFGVDGNGNTIYQYYATNLTATGTTGNVGGDGGRAEVDTDGDFIYTGGGDSFDSPIDRFNNELTSVESATGDNTLRGLHVNGDFLYYSDNEGATDHAHVRHAGNLSGVGQATTGDSRDTIGNGTNTWTFDREGTQWEMYDHDLSSLQFTADRPLNVRDMVLLDDDNIQYEIGRFGNVSKADVDDGLSVIIRNQGKDGNDNEGQAIEYLNGNVYAAHEGNVTKYDEDLNQEVEWNGTNVLDVVAFPVEDVDESQLALDVKTFMDHGSTQTYTVRLGTEDVTDESSVTSSDSGVVSVDEANTTLTATSDESVNAQVTITAVHEDATVEEPVTVANKTLDNIGILPPATWPVAIIGQPGDTTGASGTWPGAIQLQWLFVCMAVGAIVSWRSVNPFMGLGTVEIMLAFGWVINWISDGLLIASIIFLVYASLSLTDIASGNLGHR